MQEAVTVLQLWIPYHYHPEKKYATPSPCASSSVTMHPAMSGNGYHTTGASWRQQIRFTVGLIIIKSRLYWISQKFEFQSRNCLITPVQNSRELLGIMYIATQPLFHIFVWTASRFSRAPSASVDTHFCTQSDSIIRGPAVILIGGIVLSKWYLSIMTARPPACFSGPCKWPSVNVFQPEHRIGHPDFNFIIIIIKNTCL